MRYLALSVATAIALGGCHVRHDRRPPLFWPADFNADGFADVAVGAPLDDDGTPGSDRGRVYVHLGSASPDAAFDVVLSGAEDGSRFGFSVAAGGDFNGDGQPDLAVGAPLEDAGGVNRGRVYIFFGGAGFGAPGLALSGAEDNGQFGFSVARAGDVDGDGLDDLIMGAPFESGGGAQRGRAYLFLGGAPPSGVPALAFDGGEDSSQFGLSVNTAGDFNGDGFFDWMIGAPLDDADGNTTDGGLDRGRAFVYFGGTAPDNSVDLVLSGAQEQAHFGASVAGLLDVDVDGFDDVAIGAPLDDGNGLTTDSGVDVGRVYFFHGSSLPSSVPALTFTGAESGSHFGEVVARVGDVNAGGAPDMLVGAPLENAGGVERGRAYLFFGGPSMDTTADVVYTGTEDGARFGASADSPGDFDGDGIRDVVIGAPLATAGGVDRGQAFLFRGAFSPASVVAVAFSGTEDGAQFGAAVP